MPGEVEKKVLEVWLPDLHVVQAGRVGGQRPQAIVDVVGFDFNDTLGFEHFVFDSGQVTVEVPER